MSIFSRKKDSASAQIQNARLELDRVNATIADRRKRREAALLAATDDFSEVEKLDAELADLERGARLWGDKIELLEQQARKEDAEATARRKAAHIERIEQKLAARDQVGVELQETIAQADKLFHRLLALSDEVAAAWPWATTDLAPALMTGPSIKTAVAHSIYRHARPFIGGPQRPEESFPGGASPSIAIRGTPEKAPAIADALKQASAHASAIMRGKHG